MNSKQEEAVQRITAQYVAEMHAGQKPQLSTYIARYPQYANEIAAFIAYFHAFEEDIPEDVPVEASIISSLPAKFLIAIDSANARIAQEQLRADTNLPTHLSQVAEAPGPYQLNKPSNEQTPNMGQEM